MDFRVCQMMSEGQEPMNTVNNEPLVEAQLESGPPVPESPNAPTDSCWDDGDEDLEPLSERFFHIEISKSHVGDLQHKYQLVIPAEFARTIPNKALQVSLTHGGRTWEMNCVVEIRRPSYKRFDSGWKAFAQDNMLKTGDYCIFELKESSDTALKFKVRILRGDFPSALLVKQDGTTEHPIIVD